MSTKGRSNSSSSASANAASGQPNPLRFGDPPEVARWYQPPPPDGRRPGTSSEPASRSNSLPGRVETPPPPRPATSSTLVSRGGSQVAQQQQASAASALAVLPFPDLCAGMPLQDRFPIYIWSQPLTKLTLNHFNGGFPEAIQLYIAIKGQRCAFRINCDRARCSPSKFPRFAYDFYTKYIFDKATNGAIGWFAYHFRTGGKKSHHRIIIEEYKD